MECYNDSNMKYTNEQKEAVKRSFKKPDRKVLEKLYKSEVIARQIASGSRRVSLRRAKQISEALGRKRLVKLLIPELN